MEAKNMLLMLVVLGLGLHLTASDSSLGGPADWLKALSAVLSIGNTFLSAVEKFKEWADEKKGSAMITISNYCNSTDLVDVRFHTVVGTIDEIHFDVDGGEKQGISAHGPDFRQTEGLVGWTLPDTDMKAVVYWRVPHDAVIIEQKSNKLGIGFVNGSNPDWLKNLATSSEDLFIPTIGMSEYSTDGETMQCCYGSLCLQGLMTTNHHCEISIRILPKNAADLFHHEGTESKQQSNLDEVLNQANTCTSQPSGSPAVATTAKIVWLLMSIVPILV